MIVKRKSPLTGAIHERDLPITEQQLYDWIDGALVQDAFPQLSAAGREFIKTGITPEEWEEYIGDEDE